MRNMKGRLVQVVAVLGMTFLMLGCTKLDTKDVPVNDVHKASIQQMEVMSKHETAEVTKNKLQKELQMKQIRERHMRDIPYVDRGRVKKPFRK